MTQGCTISGIAATLDDVYGPRRWRSHGEPLDELIGTVLSQHTSDINTERAFRSLKGRFPTWEEVRVAPTGEVAEAIRSGGLAQIKAPRIQRILEILREERGELSLDWILGLPVAEARAALMALPGVGPKTASCVLLFSLGLPAMPVDTHVHRLSLRLGLAPPKTSADAAHTLIEGLVGADRDAVYALHLNLIAHGKAICIARNPRCGICPLQECCDYYRTQTRTDRDRALDEPGPRA
ncbi:MAG: endonuclease III domain-containing protein [Chloroflexota bacterium]